MTSGDDARADADAVDAFGNDGIAGAIHLVERQAGHEQLARHGFNGRGDADERRCRSAWSFSTRLRRAALLFRLSIGGSCRIIAHAWHSQPKWCIMVSQWRLPKLASPSDCPRPRRRAGVTAPRSTIARSIARSCSCCARRCFTRRGGCLPRLPPQPVQHGLAIRTPAHSGRRPRGDANG